MKKREKSEGRAGGNWREWCQEMNTGEGCCVLYD